MIDEEPIVEVMREEVDEALKLAEEWELKYKVMRSFAKPPPHENRGWKKAEFAFFPGICLLKVCIWIYHWGRIQNFVDATLGLQFLNDQISRGFTGLWVLARD